MVRVIENLRGQWLVSVDWVLVSAEQVGPGVRNILVGFLETFGDFWFACLFLQLQHCFRNQAFHDLGDGGVLLSIGLKPLLSKPISVPIINMVPNGFDSNGGGES